MSINYGGFYCVDCLYSFSTKNKLELQKRVCENKDFCNVIIPSEDTKRYEFHQFQKSDKVPFIIYTDFACIVEKTGGCKDNPENLSTKKVSEHIQSGFSMSTISLFRSIENKHDICRDRDSMKKFCESLRKLTMKIINFKKKKMWLLMKKINFKKKKMKLLTKEQQQS